MLDFLKPILGGQSYLGVDIGTTSIKVVKIVKGETRPRLQDYAILETYEHLERLNSAIQVSSLKIAEQGTAELLKMLLEKIKIESFNVVASIPAFSVFTTLLEIPAMPKDDTIKVVPFQIRQHIPLPVSEVAIEWFKVGEKEDEKGFLKQEILVISVPKEQIGRYQNIFKLAGLKLKALEVESLSLVRAFLLASDPTPTLIVDIGGYSTNIVVAEGGFFKYSYQIDFAGGSLTRAIASGLNINVKRAEQLKRQKGLLGGGGEYELSTLTSPFLDAIINEVKRVKNNYEKNQQGVKVERVILAGGGANLLGIDKYFEKQINLPTVIGNSFLGIEYPTKIEPFVKELNPILGVAIGLGLKEWY